MQIPDRDRILEARNRIRGHIHRTPVLHSSFFDGKFGANLHFKCENFQKTGSFKLRGALNAVLSLPDDVAPSGVVTDSSGNHGQALAFAASRRGIPAYIVMPEIAPAVKIAAVKGYGGEVHLCEPNMDARKSASERIALEKGATYISSCSHPDIVSGQASALLEFMEDTGGLDVVLTPIGGGGLLSGTVLAAKYFYPELRVIGVEPALADDAFRSLQSGTWIPSDYPPTIADGLKTSMGKLPFAILKQEATEIVTVSEEAIIRAMRLIWERMKIIVEASSAVVLAALLEDQVAIQGLRVGLILSGGNVNLDPLPWQS